MLIINQNYSSASPGSTRSEAMVASTEATSCAHTLFQQPWWLEAVAPNGWHAAIVVKDNEVVGRLPFVRKRRFGLTILSLPPLTPFLGPWVNAETEKPEMRLEREHEILQSLISALPKHDVFLQDFHYSAYNWLPFYWNGFFQTVMYSYVLDDLLDHDRLWNGLRKTVRRHIRNAERQLSVRATDDIEILISLNRMTFERQGLPLPYSPDLLRNLDAGAHAALRPYGARAAVADPVSRAMDKPRERQSSNAAGAGARNFEGSHCRFAEA